MKGRIWIFVVPDEAAAEIRDPGPPIAHGLDAEACQRNHPTRARSCAPVGSPLRCHPPQFLLGFIDNVTLTKKKFRETEDKKHKKNVGYCRARSLQVQNVIKQNSRHLLRRVQMR